MARLIELTTPLGRDVLLFRAMRGREELARLSEFDLSALSTRADINPADLLGKSVTVKLELRGGGHRYLNGYVTRFGQGGMVGRYHHYRMILRPWLWFLTRTTDSRIFQERTVPEIVKDVFADHPLAAVDDSLTAKYAQREYCVQYRETDFDFVSRLMEEEGIYYYFEHEDGRHVLKLVDSDAGHRPLTQKARIPYFPPGRPARPDEEGIQSWTFSQTIQAGVVALDDYNFKNPRGDLKVKAKLIQRHEQADHELFDWPGEYGESGDGEHLARARIDELHTEFEQAEAECNVREIAVGRLFTLVNAPRRDQEREYLIVSAEYELRDNAYETSPEEGGTYRCAFRALQSRQQFRPARRTLRPTAKGPHTAVVVGPAGEEIHCDAYGRVKVQFHWDRHGSAADKAEQHSSCWMRVAQNVAGKRWGMVFIPRIGQEVLVDFEEGDPDRPIVVGAFYNGQEMPPYPLPEHKTRTVIFKSNSTPGGDGFNEIRVEDKKDEEQIFVHAQNDLDLRIQHDRREWVGRDRHLVAKRDKVEEVGRDEHVRINRDLVEQVDRDHHLTVTGKRAIKVDGSQSVQVNGAVAEEFAMSHSEEVGLTYSLTAGMTVVIEGGVGLTIKAAGSFITLSPAGVQISGPLIMLNSGGAPLMAPPTAAVTPIGTLEAEIADSALAGGMDETYRQQRAARSLEEQAVRDAPWHDPRAAASTEPSPPPMAGAPAAGAAAGDGAGLDGPAQAGQKKKSWIEIELVDDRGKPVPGERYRVTLPDGTTLAEGTLDEKGFARVDNIDPGTCKVTFPALDKDAWKPA